ncbi:MAG: type II toxin-antitoxin system Phd/YefM family antitoxin [Pseudomonadota bacterium]
MDAIEVDIQEFRADLAKYIALDSSVAITQDGKKVGYFTPVAKYGAAEVAALKKAGEALDHAFAGREIDVEEAVADFEMLRKESRPS